MSDQNFTEYLEYRIQKAGALTPGQKQEVVEELIREAREDGKVPSSSQSVSRVNMSDPRVQAILRGEPVSGVSNYASGMAMPGISTNGLAERPTWQKVLLLVAPLLLVALLIPLAFWLTSPSAAQADGGEATALAELPIEAPTMEPTETATQEPTATPEPPPTATPQPTPVPALIGGVSSPAASANDPASLEMRGRLFVLQQGEVDKKSGAWLPEGPEWLAGTEVRRVISVPMAMIGDLPIVPGDILTLRTRNGRVVTYPVTQVLTLTPTQIESFIALRPSILVVATDTSQATDDAPRVVILGEMPLPTPEPTTATAQIRGYTREDVNLRDRPALKSNIIAGLPKGTWLDVPAPIQTRSAGGLVWLYVQTPYGNGWVVRDLISIAQ